MPNYVYKITFRSRIIRKEPPYYYIGSKTNVIFSNNKLINSTNKEYWGSSKYKGYNNFVIEDDPVCEILEEVKDKKLLRIREAEIQKECSAHTSIEYFNMALATDNKWIDPDYAVYKCIADANKKVRLKRDDPLVVSGLYVGLTKGYKVSTETIEKISKSLSGDKNGFFGKQHSAETKAVIGAKNHLHLMAEERRKLSSETARKTFKGKPKSIDQRKKMSESGKGYVTLKNVESGVSMRVKKSELETIDKSIWKNAYSIAAKNGTLKGSTCFACGFYSTSSAMIARWHNRNCKRGTNANN